MTRARARAWGSSKASEQNVCAFSSLKNEPKPDLAEERHGMNSRAFEWPFGIEWISLRTTVEMWTGGLGRGTYIYHQSAEYPPGEWSQKNEPKTTQPCLQFVDYLFLWASLTWCCRPKYFPHVHIYKAAHLVFKIMVMFVIFWLCSNADGQ